jgi:hypothetical protein
LEINRLERLKTACVGLRQFTDVDDGLHCDGSYSDSS